MQNTRLIPQDHAAVIDDMQSGINALKAFSTLLDAVLINDGGNLQCSDSGMFYLIGRHIDALDNGLAALRAHERAAVAQPSQ